MSDLMQLHSVNPEQLKTLIDKSLENQINSLKELLTNKPKETYLTRKQVAEMLDVNISTITNWVNSSELTAYSKGGRVYFKLSEIEESIKPIRKTGKTELTAQ